MSQTPSAAARRRLLFLLGIFISLQSAQAMMMMNDGISRSVQNQLSPARVQNTQNTQEIRTLELGQSVEREIAGGQTRRFQINLSAIQFASVRIQQRGI